MTGTLADGDSARLESAANSRASGQGEALTAQPRGPLAGVRVVELAGLGPAPFAAMVLADLGATVIRVDRASAVNPELAQLPSDDLLNRGKQSIGVDLKNPAGLETVLRLIDVADILLEGFRPGVVERLGLGPDICLGRNPRLVFGRMTGWGQTGPYSHAAGHDINYVALSGTLHAIGRKGEAPVPPMNLVGDFGGGAMLVAVGVLAALFEARNSGEGQVVDAAMVDGSALLATMTHSLLNSGNWKDERGVNMLDTGAHFYEVYETADRKYVSIGSIEPQFYAELLRLTELDEDPEFIDGHFDAAQWPHLKTRLAETMATKTRNEWCDIMEGTDVCFAPVLSLTEAPSHPHNAERQTFIEADGKVQPAPAPRFDRTGTGTPESPPSPGANSAEVLAAAGFTHAEIGELRSSGAIA